MVLVYEREHHTSRAEAIRSIAAGLVPGSPRRLSFDFRQPYQVLVPVRDPTVGIERLIVGGDGCLQTGERLSIERGRQDRRERIELRIASEVTNAALRIESIRDRIAAATASRELAEEQLQAEESKFEVGLSTNFFVLQARRDLATAQDAELRGILDYQRALIEFERTQRASLGSASVALVGGATAGGVAGPAGAAPSGPMLTPQR